MSAEELRASINRAAGMPPSGESTSAALRRAEGELDRCHRESARLDLELTKQRMANQALLAAAAEARTDADVARTELAEAVRHTAVRFNTVRAERNEAVRLLEYALHLRQHGERAPGGAETWREFDTRCETYLRGLPAARPTPHLDALKAELESARTELALLRRQRDTLRADLVRMYGRIGAARRELAHAARPDIEEKSMTTVYISIGNSDDKLSQAEWHAFHDDVRCELISAGAKFHGQWASPSTDPWQNACWCAEIGGGVVQELKANLAGLAVKHRQDSIAWAEAPVTEFLGGAE